MCGRGKEGLTLASTSSCKVEVKWFVMPLTVEE